MIRRMVAVLTLLVCAAVTELPAQQAAAGSARALLDEARAALDAFSYARAALLARSVLRPGAPITREERIYALMLLASALYPEAGYRPDSAAEVLREVVRVSPDQVIPEALSWSGLTALMTRMRAETFAISVRPSADTAVLGTDGAVIVPVVASRPARFVARLMPRGDSSRAFTVDSTRPASANSLAIRLFDGSRMMMSSGDWELQVIGIDEQTGVRHSVRHALRVNAPPIALTPVPSALDSTRLLPAWQRPRRTANVALGVAIGGVTFALAQSLRADEPVGGSVDADARVIPIAAVLAAAVGIGAYLDKGRALPANVAANDRLRASFDSLGRVRRLENDRVRSAYRGAIVIGAVLP